MAHSDYLPFAFGDGANIVSQPDWMADPDREFGFGQGRAISAKFNKAWRQATTVAAAVTYFTAQASDIDIVDDGDYIRLAEMFHQSLYDAIGGQPITNIVAGVGLVGGGNVATVTLSLDVPVRPIHGGTGQTVYSQGDILYADSQTTLARLAKNVGYRFLTNQGPNGNPAWSFFDVTQALTGILPIFNGGTAATTGYGALDNLSGAAGTTVGWLARRNDGTWYVQDPGTIESDAVCEIGDVPPPDAVRGDLWWDSTAGQLYVYFDDGNSLQWVIANTTTPPGSFPVVAQPTDYTILVSDAGTHFNNDTATGDVVWTLPAASPGLQYSGLVLAPYYVKLQAIAGDVILRGSDISVTNGYIRSNQSGAILTLEAPRQGRWVVSSQMGNWGIDL